SELVKDRWPDASVEEKAAMSMALGRADASDLLQELAKNEQSAKVQHALSLVNQGHTRQSDLRTYLAAE
ncbi:MAG: hypothetical protein RLN85_19200, partial [Pseudomonadales bacterium]